MDLMIQQTSRDLKRLRVDDERADFGALLHRNMGTSMLDKKS
eukprot:CAMPEP_0204162628 /NCGR_PEP_ID=MMETSP0361-20130328/35717_1 /ASSEMBLY_ACC=CAM_ASM_000343 /TAXON_ID=268821 /ORGANISM="Scrippsiella Hangoei, Strain SHTV-5" /LENGTH=41 /DNA_ID= /DNA_START= /DNA_END= /DNA_ORIENTATION=